MSASLILHCPSKLNLTLKVLEKKKNGMHEIKSHFQLIDLCDVMHIEKSNAQQSSIRTNASIDIDSKKNLGKQLTFANKRELPVAVICGENEFNDNTVTIKNLKGVKGENNQTIPKADLINEVKKLI